VDADHRLGRAAGTQAYGSSVSATTRPDGTPVITYAGTLGTWVHAGADASLPNFTSAAARQLRLTRHRDRREQHVSPGTRTPPATSAPRAGVNPTARRSAAMQMPGTRT
jgi:hypothetical protein